MNTKNTRVLGKTQLPSDVTCKALLLGSSFSSFAGNAV
jgi:hypothetical protein